MAITYPRPMPELTGMAGRLTLERVDYLSPERTGVIGGVTAGWPLWMMRLSFNNMAFRDDDELTAWLDSLRGSQKRFFGYDQTRPEPRFHANGRPYTKTTATWSQSIDSEGTCNLTLGGLLRGQVFSPRDYVGFEWGDNRRALVRSLERGVVSVGGTVTIAVEPAVHAVVPPTATVQLYRPSCLMRILTDDTELMDQGLAFVGAGSRIAAVQDIIA
ncbi:hypothetical protein [Sphingomonas sanxanigenens]|uniref:TIGR02217 family protein n=1 Tax=Sphingomonas sanxanigenens DSM 19645 = NX02 TaxID=1123269 RepID=W0A6F4_9SPHN|nr:hypothetical protein [Sphingomonas sanxanigenens]AHE52641.1 hypothetical protein NX02_04485 [Sphingomonas sanxanigenens DSM 19645 = NX02]